jgi:two-component system, OmpR family, response regulator
MDGAIETRANPRSNHIALPDAGHTRGMQHSLLLAEDDGDLRDLVVRALREEAFAIEGVGSGSALLRAYDARGADLLILDVGLPDADGRDVCATLRARGDEVPVVFLTARDAVPERVAGFDVGGDDYVTKPFVLAELAERIRALLRRSGRRPALAAGALRLDSLAHAAVNGDSSVPLTPIEFGILSALLEWPGDVVRRRTLATAAWPVGDAVLDNTLEVCVSRLRRKLATIDSTATIETVHGVGYRISA